jgi:hypothetical protein
VTVIEADLWQLGQLKAGDKVRFVAVDVPTARRLAAGRRAELATLQAQDVAWQPVPLTSPVVMTCGDADKRLVARLSGDTHLLLEAGEAELDLVLRFRIHALMQALEEQAREGIIDITPGIRSLQLHFQPETLALETLLAWVRVGHGLHERRSAGANAGGASPALLGRPGLPQGDRQIYDHRPPGRPVVPKQPRVYSPDKRSAG